MSAELARRMVGRNLTQILTDDRMLSLMREIDGPDPERDSWRPAIQLGWAIANLQQVTITSSSYSPKRDRYQVALKGDAGTATMFFQGHWIDRKKLEGETDEG